MIIDVNNQLKDEEEKLGAVRYLLVEYLKTDSSTQAKVATNHSKI